MQSLNMSEINAKNNLRNEIKMLTDEFLKRGGVINGKPLPVKLSDQANYNAFRKK